MMIKTIEKLTFSKNTELCDLAYQEGTDKGSHGYTKIYNNYLNSKKNDKLNIFEIGIYQGCSLKMWNRYFKNSKIFGIDNGRIGYTTDNKAGISNENPSTGDENLLKIGNLANVSYSHIENENIKCFIADQRSEFQLSEAFNYFNCKNFNVIIDDGHHYQEHQQKSLGLLFKHLNSGGFYFIEDIADIKKLLNGEYWGQKNKNGTDSTHYLFKNFIENGIFNSDYMSDEESEYFLSNIKTIKLIECNFSILLCIEKK